MISMIRLVVLALAGLVMASYGVFHSIESYPGAEVFNRLSAAMPMLMKVSSFALGVLFAVAGSVMLSIAFLRLLRGKPHAPAETHVHSAARTPPPPYREEQPDGDEYEVDEEQERPDIVGRARDNGRFDNGRFDRRRWANSHR